MVRRPPTSTRPTTPFPYTTLVRSRRVADSRCYSAKTQLDERAVAILSDLAVAQGFAARRKTLFAGGIANPTEDRAAEHSAERGEGAPESVHRAQGLHQRMRMLVDAIEAEIGRAHV